MRFKIFDCLGRNISLLVFIFCLTVACFSLFTVLSSKIILEECSENENIYKKTAAFTDYRYNISVTYPLTENKNVNKKILDFISGKVKSAKNDSKYFLPKSEKDKLSLTVNFSTTRANSNIVSFIYFINYSDGSSFFRRDIETATYNLKTGRELTLTDFFDERLGFVNVLCSKSRESLLNNPNVSDKNLAFFIDDITFSLQNSFHGYSFSNDCIHIYFNSNKISSKLTDIYEIKIPWEDVKHLLKENIMINP
jgi:hypothetical protein